MVYFSSAALFFCVTVKLFHFSIGYCTQTFIHICCDTAVWLKNLLLKSKPLKATSEKQKFSRSERAQLHAMDANSDKPKKNPFCFKNLTHQSRLISGSLPELIMQHKSSLKSPVQKAKPDCIHLQTWRVAYKSLPFKPTVSLLLYPCFMEDATCLDKPCLYSQANTFIYILPLVLQCAFQVSPAWEQNKTMAWGKKNKPTHTTRTQVRASLV